MQRDRDGNGKAAPLGDPVQRRPPVRDHLRAWLAIGSQSVGGGAATLYLMRRILVRQREWLTDVEFSQDWTLSKTSPGLTLIALAALLGKRIGGWLGLVIALTGLLLPSVALTLAMAAGFAYIRDQPLVQAAIRGIAPATIGLTLAMMVIFARSSMRKGRARWIDGTLLVAVIAAAALLPGMSVPIIIAGAVIGWILLGVAPPTVATLPPANEIVADGRED
jgi:chromate transporter